MKITPVKGTNDYLPSDTALRDGLQNKILEVYRAAGYERISTPIIEDVENLDKSEGGENLNLIFKVMKRGEKLQEALDRGAYGELADIGLRYDLTLPLCRYYANNRAFLPSPFKCIQTDRVYRAERPQKGRLREFVQCDIDVLGDERPECEIELIHTTAKALKALGFSGFTVKVNDRRLLRLVLTVCGFAEGDFDSVCISLDKLDKIGQEGVKAELSEKGFDEAAVGKLASLFDGGVSVDAAASFVNDTEVSSRLGYIIESARALTKGLCRVEFDLTLIRGQGYYTGTVFEIEMPGYKGAVAGGGRYDNLIGKFIGEKVPAVGFSIGFERIFGILKEEGRTVSGARKRIGVIYEGDFAQAVCAAEELRKEYDCGLFLKSKKFGKLLGNLEKSGYDGYADLSAGGGVKLFADRQA